MTNDEIRNDSWRLFVIWVSSLIRHSSFVIYFRCVSAKALDTPYALDSSAHELLLNHFIERRAPNDAERQQGSLGEPSSLIMLSTCRYRGSNEFRRQP
jgi:hypothetical protein